MSKTQKHNQGFSFIELLIALTILSIVMIMVVQFMGTSTAAYQKNKSNLNLQNEAMQVLEQMSDTLMQAKYVRVVTKDEGMYLIEHKDGDGDGDKERVISTPTTYTPVTFDFVPDNYGNYAKCSDFTTSDRKVIVDFDTFEIVNEKKKTYPLISSPTDNDVVYTDLNGNKTIMLASQSVRSFRALKNGTVYNYIKPQFIYAEYSTSNKKTVHVIYHITDVTDSRDNTCSIYMYRYETDDTNPTEAKVKNYNYARTQVMGLLGKGYETTRYSANTDTFVTNKESATALQAIKDGAQGMITSNISDFYLSADSEGNAILTNIMFKDGKYTYNTVETINFRNSNVLTVRPQKLYKLVN